MNPEAKYFYPIKFLSKLRANAFLALKNSVAVEFDVKEAYNRAWSNFLSFYFKMITLKKKTFCRLSWAVVPYVLS